MYVCVLCISAQGITYDNCLRTTCFGLITMLIIHDRGNVVLIVVVPTSLSPHHSTSIEELQTPVLSLVELIRTATLFHYPPYHCWHMQCHYYDICVTLILCLLSCKPCLCCVHELFSLVSYRAPYEDRQDHCQVTRREA